MRHKNIVRYSLFLLTLFLKDILAAYKAPTTDSGLGGVAANLFQAELNLHGIVKAICITAGAGLILGAVIRYKKHRKNPYEATLSSVVTNLVIGIVLILLAFIPLSI